MGEMPYIGAKISLISKGDIRYEGTLYSIDMNESTIALHNGASLFVPPAVIMFCGPRQQGPDGFPVKAFLPVQSNRLFVGFVQ